MIHAQASKRSQLLTPQAMTNTATATANLDCKGADYAVLTIAFAIEKNTNGVGPTIALTESDDTVATNFATFDADFARAAETLVAAKNVVYHVDLKARKRYLRLSVTTATATNDDITLAAVAELSRLGESPASSSDMVASGDVCVVG